MYGVIICPKCHRARGVSLSTKKAACSHCGHVINVSLARVYHRTESQEELVLAVQKMTEKLAVSIEDYPAERKRPARPAPEPAKRSLGSEEGLRHLLIDITSTKVEFGTQDLMALLAMKEEEVSNLIQRMMQAGLIFEPAPGRYRSLTA